jgi:hypothetical protein
LLSRGMAPAVHLALVAILSALVLLVACPAVLPHVPQADHPDAATPRANRWRSPALWALGATALVALIAEGAMYDWATVYMRDVVVATPRSRARRTRRFRAAWRRPALPAMPCAPASAPRNW